MTAQLKRCLGLTDIIIYGVGLILGAGIYVLIGSAAGVAGNMLWMSFLLAALVASFTAVSYSELSALYPKAGAEYVYAHSAFGLKGLAWVLGFIAVVVGFSTASAVAVGFAGYFVLFVPMDKTLVAMAVVVLLSVVSFWGIKESARFNAIATTIEVGGLMVIILVGGFYIFRGQIPLADLMQLPPVKSPDTMALMPVVSAGALIFFAYMGFEDIANIAEEAENPSHILPRAFIYSLVISTIIYVLVAIVAVSVVPFQELADSEQPLSHVMSLLIGGSASQVMAVIALFATANTVLITLIVCARMVYGMAREGSLPVALSTVHSSRQTPYVAVLLVGLFSISFLFFEEIEVLASISDVGIFILFLMVNMSNIGLRYRRPELHRPWRAPINIGRMPVISVLGAISCLLMLFSINHPVEIAGGTYSSLIVGLLIFALAIPLYFVLGKTR